MLSIAGMSGAGVARQSVSPDHRRESSSTVSTTPRSMLSMASAAGMLGEGGDGYQAVEKEPVTEGNLRIINHVRIQQEVMCCKYSEDGSLLAIGLIDGSIKIHSSETGDPMYNLADSETKGAHLPCTSLNFKHHLDGDKSSNLLLATYASGMVKLWHTATGQCLHTTHETRQTLAAAFNPTTSLFATTGTDDKIHIYDASTRKLVQTCQPSPSMNVMDGHRSRVFSIKFHPKNGNEFVTGGWDDTLQFWEVGTEHAIRKSYGPHICGDAIDIDAQHNHILTGSWRKTDTLQIWDYPSGNLIKTVPKDINNSLLYCAQWLGKDHIVAGGCDANMVRVIDRGTLQTTGRVVDLYGGVYGMDSNRSSPIPRFAVGSSRSLLFLEIKRT